MAFEALYHPNLRLPYREKCDLLLKPDAESVWMYDRRSRRLIGETYGVPVTHAEFKKDEQGYKDVSPFFGTKTIYVYSTTTLPAYQDQGFGKILKAYFLGMVSKRFERAIGHARAGGSVHLNRLFGARFGKTYPDWFESGEPYTFYVMELR